MRRKNFREKVFFLKKLQANFINKNNNQGKNYCERKEREK